MPTARPMPSQPRATTTPPPAKRPPRVLQVVRDTASPLATAEVDWRGWYLDEEDDTGHFVLHGLICTLLVQLLQRWMAERGQLKRFVQGDVFFQWVQDQPKVQISPDAFIIDALPTPLPESFQTWLPGHLPPRFAVEVVSKDWRKDYDDNPPKYGHLGAKKLVICDHLHDAHRRQSDRMALQVFRRTADGAFVRVHAGPGPAYSAELGAWLMESGKGAERRLRLARDAAGTDLVLSAEEEVAVLREELARLRQ